MRVTLDRRYSSFWSFVVFSRKTRLHRDRTSSSETGFTLETWRWFLCVQKRDTSESILWGRKHRRARRETSSSLQRKGTKRLLCAIFGTLGFERGWNRVCVCGREDDLERALESLRRKRARDASGITIRKSPRQGLETYESTTKIGALWACSGTLQTRARRDPRDHRPRRGAKRKRDPSDPNASWRICFEFGLEFFFFFFSQVRSSRVSHRLCSGLGASGALHSRGQLRRPSPPPPTRRRRRQWFSRATSESRTLWFFGDEQRRALVDVLCRRRAVRTRPSASWLSASPLRVSFLESQKRHSLFWNSALWSSNRSLSDSGEHDPASRESQRDAKSTRRVARRRQARRFARSRTRAVASRGSSPSS